MRKEIDILLQAASRDCAVVEKDSNILWNLEDLLAAGNRGEFQGEDQLGSPDDHAAVTSPYPGCMQLVGSAQNYRAVGQTAHFIIFALDQYPACVLGVERRSAGV